MSAVSGVGKGGNPLKNLALISILTVALVALGLDSASAATLTVVNTDDAGPGSLRQAIIDAGPGDTVTFDASLDDQTITLTSGELTIDKNLTVVGPASGIAVSGNDASRVFLVTGAVSVDMTGVNVTHGSVASYGGGILVENGADLTLADGSITDSRVTASYGGAMAVWPNSTAALNNVEVSSNTSSGFASGLYVEGTINLTNVTISENTAAFSGTALMLTPLFTSPNANLVNVTITNNSSPQPGLDEAVSVGSALGLATLNLTNTIVANQAMGADCSVGLGATINSLGHNIDSDGSCVLGGPGDQPNTDPLLSPLALNAPSLTQTHAIDVDSPAFDAGDDGACPAADQRGVSRPQGAHCDIGAYEAILAAPTPSPTSVVTDDWVAPTPTPSPTPAQLPATGAQEANGSSPLFPVHPTILRVIGIQLLATLVLGGVVYLYVEHN